MAPVKSGHVGPVPTCKVKNLNENVRLPYAQWALSLVPYIINFFKLDDMGLTIQITEPAIVESQNQRLVEANHVIEVSFSSTNARPCHEFEAVYFSMHLLEPALMYRSLAMKRIGVVVYF